MRQCLQLSGIHGESSLGKDWVEDLGGEHPVTEDKGTSAKNPLCVQFLPGTLSKEHFQRRAFRKRYWLFTKLHTRSIRPVFNGYTGRVPTSSNAKIDTWSSEIY